MNAPVKISDFHRTIQMRGEATGDLLYRFGVTRWSWEIEGQTGTGFRLVL
jgi:hypothetical protein